MGRALLMHAPKPWKRSRLLARSFRLRRCLIPADGILRRRTGRERRPYYIQPRDEAPVMFAGVWDTWRNRGELITSCAIITTAANELVQNFMTECLQSFLPNFKMIWLVRKQLETICYVCWCRSPLQKMKLSGERYSEFTRK